MKYIEKSDEPQELFEYKQTPGVCFEGMPSEVKIPLKIKLVTEQGYLCCYCGKRIEIDPSTILEHLKCQNNYAELELCYNNILASCDGGQGDRSGKSKKEKKHFPDHCDAKKDDHYLKLTPLDDDCEDRFTYGSDGRIYGENDDAQRAIEILGLNCLTIINRRKAVIEAYIELSQLDPAPSKEYWNSKIRDNSTLNKDGKYPEYCFAAKYYIRRYLL